MEASGGRLTGKGTCSRRGGGNMEVGWNVVGSVVNVVRITREVREVLLEVDDLAFHFIVSCICFYVRVGSHCV